MNHPEREVARHYAHGSLLAAIFEAMKESGLDPDRLAADQLSPIDEFHTGGRAATADFADQMKIVPGMRLLDVGSGIGGPSRYFAQHRGCTVAGVDLSAEFCDAARELSQRTGLADRTRYFESSAASLPFEDASFDGAYMLHVGMNLSGKAEVFQEVARVLKPGGVFGIFDIMREKEGELLFPVPWAASADLSFVENAAQYVEQLRHAGFAIDKQRNRRDFSLAFFAKFREAAAAAKAAGGPPKPGVSILMGPSAPVKVGNLVKMLESEVIAPVEIVSRLKVHSLA